MYLPPTYSQVLFGHVSHPSAIIWTNQVVLEQVICTCSSPKSSQTDSISDIHSSSHPSSILKLFTGTFGVLNYSSGAGSIEKH